MSVQETVGDCPVPQRARPFDPPGRTYAFGLGTSSQKLAGPAVPAGELGPIDAILVSHDHHADNLDDAGRALLPGTQVVVTTVPGHQRLQLPNVRGLKAWEDTTLTAPGKPALKITATPCRHGPPLSRPIVGEVIGFALQPEGHDRAVWFSGDTVLYPGVREVAQRIPVDVAVLNLGQVQFGITGPLHYSMNLQDAIELIRLIGPRVAVPVHFEGWSHFHEQEAALDRALKNAPEDVVGKIRRPVRGTLLDL